MMGIPHGGLQILPHSIDQSMIVEKHVLYPNKEKDKQK